jgi:putative copper export protein
VAVLDATGRFAGFGGAMLGFGLPLIGLAVLLPCLGEWPRLVHRIHAAALGLAALGSAALIVSGSIGLEGTSSPLEYAVGTRTGVLLSGRLLVAAAGSGLVLALGPGPRSALVGGVAGAVCLVLVAIGSHAAAGGGIGPILADLVHLAAAGAWLAGLLALTLLAVGALGAAASSPPMRVAVPRFSALALVSIALIAATGLYASWQQVGSPDGLGTPYGILLVVKVALVGTAVALGAVNYFDGGRGTATSGGLRRRVSIELGLAALIVLASANLTSGSPPAQVETVKVPAGSEDAGFGLAIQPAVPGPNRAFVTAPLPGIHTETIELQLARLDAGTGATRVPLRSDPNQPHGVGFMVDGLLLPDGSRWDASVVVRDADGVETARQRFSFTMAASGLEVERGFTLSPGLVIGGGLLLVAVLALAYWLGGGSLPRTARDLGRQAILAGGLAAGLLAVALLLLGPPS